MHDLEHDFLGMRVLSLFVTTRSSTSNWTARAITDHFKSQGDLSAHYRTVCRILERFRREKWIKVKRAAGRAVAYNLMPGGHAAFLAAVSGTLQLTTWTQAAIAEAQVASVGGTSWADTN